MLTLSKSDRKLFLNVRKKIKDRLLQFRTLDSTKWLREVCLCLLTPQSSPISAENAMVKLESEGLFTGCLNNQDIETILRRPPGGGYVRFHVTKAKRVFEFIHNLPSIEDVIFSNLSPYQERQQLVILVKGFGMKEASHSLRNIGRKNLAILDRHILRCLFAYRVIKDPKISLSVKNYISIEQKFLEFSSANRTSIDELDLFFWWKATGFIFK